MQEMKYNQIKDNWFKTFFNKYYFWLYSKKDIFSLEKTQKEVNFITKTLNLPKGAKILDLACGQGRHAISLARKGYKITGLDLNRKMLILAKKLAKKQGVKLELICQDMRKINFKNNFDAVINLFSSFGYFRFNKENLKVLKKINQALKPKGKFLLDLLNKNWLLNQLPPSKRTWWQTGQNYILEEFFFEKNEKAYLNHLIICAPGKKPKHTFTYLRLYNLPEIKKYLQKSGFKILKTYGDYKGDKFTSTSPRLIILAQKNN